VTVLFEEECEAEERVEDLEWRDEEEAMERSSPLGGKAREEGKGRGLRSSLESWEMEERRRAREAEGRSAF
jgi:hypothetical protein